MLIFSILFFIMAKHDEKTLSMWLIDFGIDFGGCKVFIAESMAKVMKHWQTTSLRKAILFLLLLTMN